MKNINVSLKKHIRGNLLQYISPLAVVLLVIVFRMINKSFLSERNIRNLLEDVGPLLVASCAASFIILLGSIDLSVGTVISCTSILIAVSIGKISCWSYLLIFAYGILTGLLNGWIFTRFRVPSFIVTMATMNIWQSAAYLISASPQLVPTEKWPLINWLRWKEGIFTTSIIIGIAVVVLCYFIQHNTATGKSLYAIGANETAARLAGIKVQRVKMIAFIICGFLCSLAGLMLTASMRTGTPTIGNDYGLMSIAAVALGGSSLSGGKGNSFNTLLGALLVTLIDNGMTIIAVDAFWRNVIFGILIIIAISITSDRSNRNAEVK